MAALFQIPASAVLDLRLMPIADTDNVAVFILLRAEGKRADLVLLDKNLNIHIVIRNGEII